MAKYLVLDKDCKKVIGVVHVGGEPGPGGFGRVATLMDKARAGIGDKDIQGVAEAAGTEYCLVQTVDRRGDDVLRVGEKYEWMSSMQVIKNPASKNGESTDGVKADTAADKPKAARKPAKLASAKNKG